ncbi:MAG: hypothetical protein OER21_10530 [Gemmatimonadota bacterium]|nr:hypothetical protein [Gemmatimonadota bacterium]
MVDSDSPARPLSAGSKTRFLRAVLALGSEGPVHAREQGVDSPAVSPDDGSAPDDAQAGPDTTS